MKMSKLILVLAVVAFGLNRAGVLPSSAEAAPKWQAQLTSTDAGGTNTFCLDAGIGNSAVVSLQTTAGIPFCFKTCATGATCASDCTKDFSPNRSTYRNLAPDSGLVGSTEEIQGNPTTGPIPMGSDRCIQARAFDGGSPVVNVFLLTGQPLDPR